MKEAKSRAKRLVQLMGIAAIVGTMMAGCSGGGTNGSGTPVTTGASVTLNSFTVTGSDAKTVEATSAGLSPAGGSIAIDGSQASGVFSLSWNTSTSSRDGEIMEADLSISANGATDDLKVFGQNCDMGSIGSAYCPSAVAANIVCTYSSTDQSLNCPQDGQAIDTYRVGAWLTAHGGQPLWLRLKASVVSDGQGDLQTEALAVPVTLQ